MAKRRFYFEHAAGAICLRPYPTTKQLRPHSADGLAGDAHLVRDMVLAVNRFYEPDWPGRRTTASRLAEPPL